MLNLQVLASYFMFVSLLPYGTFTVVTFVTRFFDADRTQNEVLGAYRIESRYRLSTAKSSSAKRMAIRFWTHSRREGAFILLSEENEKSEPFSYQEKVRIFYFNGSPPGRRSYGSRNRALTKAPLGLLLPRLRQGRAVQVLLSAEKRVSKRTDAKEKRQPF